jgi:hypothetical protein
MLSVHNARTKQRIIHSHRKRGVYEGIVESMKKGINLRNKNLHKIATQGREMGKEKERQLELTKINTRKKRIESVE